MVEEAYQVQSSCDECEVNVLDHQRFCPNCGAHLSAEPVTINIFNHSSLRQLFFFYFSYLFVCLLVKYTTWFDSYDEMFWIEIVLAVITLRFAWLNRTELRPVLKFNNFRWYLLIGVIGLAVGASSVISYSVQEVNVTFFNSEVSYYKAYRLYYFPALLMIYSIALMPAIFEEITFRGVMYNLTASFLDERLAVIVTAFLFAIMHLSLISLIWLLPFGIFIGHLRRKYNTIWYGVVFHFMFNFTAVFIDLYRQGEVPSFISF
ncbi:MAG: family intrarane metalloprotease [Segetibacter sp.]|nr:family intrarane metalloprotease [Segetibacter sp.]